MENPGTRFRVDSISPTSPRHGGGCCSGMYSVGSLGFEVCESESQPMRSCVVGSMEEAGSAKNMQDGRQSAHVFGHFFDHLANA